MKRTILSILMLAAASTSNANPNLFTDTIMVACLPQNEVIRQIMGTHKERLVFESRSPDGYLYVLTSNRETETWSLLRDNRNGTACLVAAGQGFIKR